MKLKEALRIHGDKPLLWFTMAVENDFKTDFIATRGCSPESIINKLEAIDECFTIALLCYAEEHNVDVLDILTSVMKYACVDKIQAQMELTAKSLSVIDAFALMTLLAHSSEREILDKVKEVKVEVRVRFFEDELMRYMSEEPQTVTKEVRVEVPTTVTKTIEMPVLKEIYDDDMYDDYRRQSERVAQLERRLAILETAITPEKEKEAGVVYEDAVKDIDLSQYKILIVGRSDNAECYPFEWIDVTSNTDKLKRIPYRDYILFDTRIKGHKTYWAVKNECKRCNVPLLHINCRNKDRIITEIKEAIAHKEGIV